MRAVILAAGVGNRLGLDPPAPKILLRFGGETLLSRHLRILRRCGVGRVDICVGFRSEEVLAEIARTGSDGWVAGRLNPRFEESPILSLWTLRDSFRAGEAVIFMDGDVLCDHRMMERLISAPAPNCFLMDRNLEPGEEPVKLCLREGRLVDIHKRPEAPHDSAGEWIGFARFAPDAAERIAAATQGLVDAGRIGGIYEEAFREVLRSSPEGSFGIEDVSDLPWIEIDFPGDLERAEREVFPRLRDLPG